MENVVTRVSYYSPKKRVYVALTTRKTDIYYDIENDEWKPKKTAKDEELLKQIFTFSGAKGMEEFKEIRKTIYESQDPEVKKVRDKERLIEKNLKTYNKYIGYCKNHESYYSNGFEKLETVLESLRPHMDITDKESVVEMLRKEKRIDRYNKQYRDSIYYVKERYGLYHNGIDKCRDALEKLKGLGVGTNEKEAELNEIVEKKTKESKAHKLDKYLNWHCKDILKENVLKYKDFDSFEEYKSYCDNQENKAATTAIDYIKSFGCILISEKESFGGWGLLKLFMADEEKKFSLQYPGGIDKEYYKACIKHLNIGEWDRLYSIDVDLERVAALNLDFQIINVGFEPIIKGKEEVRVPDVVENLQSGGMYENTGKQLFVAETNSKFSQYDFITKKSDYSRSGATARYYIDDDHDFSDGYYVVKWGSWKHREKVFYEVDDGKWYKLDLEFKKVRI